MMPEWMEDMYEVDRMSVDEVVDRMTIDEVGELIGEYGYTFYGYENGQEVWLDDRGRGRSRRGAIAWCTGIGLEGERKR
jgi:hypothetical protein